MSQDSWIFTLDVADRPGITMRVTSVLSQRGLNIEEILGRSDADAGTGQIVLRFRADARMKDYVKRVLQRLDGVKFVLDIAAEEGLHVWQALNRPSD
jgi:acetolactate synthase-1/3 small subunit